jgi:hypothetical protein
MVSPQEKLAGKMSLTIVQPGKPVGGASSPTAARAESKRVVHSLQSGPSIASLSSIQASSAKKATKAFGSLNNLPTLLATGGVAPVKAALEQTRMRQNQSLLNTLRMESGIEQSRRKALRLAGSEAERKRLKDAHGVQREESRRRVLAAAAQAEMEMVDKMRILGVRSFAMLADVFPQEGGRFST